MRSRHTPDGQSWTPALGYRLGFGGIGTGAVVAGLLPWDGFTYSTPDIWLRLLAIALGSLTALFPQRLRLTLTREAVEMQYFLSTRVVALAEVVAVRPTQEGLLIQTADGDGFMAPALVGEKAPLSGWLRRHTASDRLAETILSARPTT